MSYRLVEQLQQKAIRPVHSCRVLSVIRSGYYGARARARCTAQPGDEEIHLKAAFHASAGSYGNRGLQKTLQDKGFKMGRYRVRSLMRHHMLRPVCQRQFVHTPDSRHDLPVADNLLNRRFRPDAMNQAWVADITNIRTRSAWLYLAGVMDLYSRKIVGWAMAPNMPAERVCAALQMAIAQRQPPAGLIVYSDRGSQYASASRCARTASPGCEHESQSKLLG